MREQTTPGTIRPRSNIACACYYEFDALNRPEGWNAWVTLAIPLGAAKK